MANSKESRFVLLKKKFFWANPNRETGLFSVLQAGDRYPVLRELTKVQNISKPDSHRRIENKVSGQ